MKTKQSYYKPQQVVPKNKSTECMSCMELVVTLRDISYLKIAEVGPHDAEVHIP